ncbi:hypothetical protein ACFL0P_01590 [Candidatus Omnitrophota bacterium]
MTTTISKILVLLYAGLFTVFAMLSGAENANGIKRVLLNLPNIAPWLLVWVAVFIAWKKPKVGGILFLALAIVSMFFFHTYQGLVQFSIISLPLVVIGILFLVKSK